MTKKLTKQDDTKIRIISGIQEVDLDGRSISEDVAMVRSALLYADKVEMYALGTSMFNQIRQISTLNNDEMLVWMLSVIAGAEATDAATREQMEMLIVGYMQLKEERDKYSRSQWRTEERLKEKRAAYDNLTKLIRTHGGAMKWNLNQMWRTHGGAEIEAAVDSGILSIKTEWADDLSKAMEANDLDQVTALMRSAIRFKGGGVMFDSMAGGLANAMHKENRLRLPQFRLDDIRETRLGNKMLLALPNMSEVDVEKLLEVREELDGDLARYKRTVSHLNERLHESAFSPDLDEEIEHLWHKEVAPQVEELREAVFSSKLGSYKDAVVAASASTAEALGWGFFGILVSNFANLDLSDPSGITAATAGAFSATEAVKSLKQGKDSFRKELRNSAEKRETAKAEGLYYLANVSHLIR